jgi:hypothetical protein
VNSTATPDLKAQAAAELALRHRPPRGPVVVSDDELRELHEGDPEARARILRERNIDPAHAVIFLPEEADDG